MAEGHGAGRGCWDRPGVGLFLLGLQCSGCYQQSGRADKVSAGLARQPGSGGDLIGSSAETPWALSVCKGLAAEARSEIQEESAVSALLHFAVPLQVLPDGENPRMCKTSCFRRSLTRWLVTGAPWGNTAAQIIPHSSNPHCSSHLHVALGCESWFSLCLLCAEEPRPTRNG